MPTETATAVMSLLMGGILEQFPRLKELILRNSHFGQKLSGQTFIRKSRTNYHPRTTHII
jgi:hypothetical protein